MGQPRSASYTAVIVVGMLIMLAGAMIAIIGFFGVGHDTAFSGEGHGFKLETTSVGLAMLAIGALFTAVVSIKMPKTVRPYSLATPDFTDRMALIGPLPFLAVAVIGFVLIVFRAFR